VGVRVAGLAGRVEGLAGLIGERVESWRIWQAHAGNGVSDEVWDGVYVAVVFYAERGPAALLINAENLEDKDRYSFVYTLWGSTGYWRLYTC